MISNEENKAVLNMMVAALFFSLMDICVKFLSHLPTVQIVFFRAFIAIVICLYFMGKQGINPWGSNKKMLIIRGLCGTLALIAYFHSFKLMPMAAAVTLQKLSPIFTVLISALWIKSKVYPKQILYFALAFLGIVFLKQFDGNITTWGIVLSVLSALGSGIAYTSIAKIRDDEHPLVIIFYFPLITLPVVIVPTVESWVWPSLSEWLGLIFVGIFVQSAQYFMTRALQKGNTARVSIYFYLGPVIAVFSSFFLFGESLKWASGIGIVLILVASVLNTMFKPKIDAI